MVIRRKRSKFLNFLVRANFKKCSSLDQKCESLDPDRESLDPDRESLDQKRSSLDSRAFQTTGV